MKLSLGACLLVAACLSPRAFAEPTWVEIPISAPGIKTSYDSSSLVIEGTRRVVWMEMRYAAPTRMRQGLVSRIVSLITYDCFRRTSRSTQVVIYAPNGEQAEESNEDDPADRVKQGTLAETQLDTVCAIPKPN